MQKIAIVLIGHATAGSRDALAAIIAHRQTADLIVVEELEAPERGIEIRDIALRQIEIECIRTTEFFMPIEKKTYSDGITIPKRKGKHNLLTGKSKNHAQKLHNNSRHRRINLPHTTNNNQRLTK